MKRHDRDLPHISVDEAVRFGRPVISGTSVPIDLVLAKLAAGLSFDELCSEYGLTQDDIRAVLAYAAETLSGEHVRAVRSTRFLVDEDLPRSLAAGLRAAGHEGLHLRSEVPEGVTA